MESAKIKSTFVSDSGEVTLNMSDNCFVSNVQEKYRKLKIGEPIISENFKRKSIYSLGFRCLWGGDSGYEAAKAAFCEEGLRLTSLSKDAFTVFEFASPWQTEFSESLSVRLSFDVTKAEMLGLFYNYPSPIVYCEDKLLKLPDAPGAYDIHLRTDALSKKAELYIGDDFVLREDYIPAKARGIYLVFKNAELVLKNVKIIKE